MFRLTVISTLSDVVFTFIEGLIGVRILLKFLGANPYTPFVIWIYQTSKPLLVPFEGIFPSPTAQGGFTLEVSALFALVIYGFIAYVIQQGLDRLEESGNVTKKKVKDED